MLILRILKLTIAVYTFSIKLLMSEATQIIQSRVHSKLTRVVHELITTIILAWLITNKNNSREYSKYLGCEKVKLANAT